MTIPDRFSVEIVEDHETIIRFLYFGTNLPVYPEWWGFIQSDFSNFNTKAIWVKSGEVLVAHALIYDTGDDTLYFGFFKVLLDEERHIEYLIKVIVDYARNNGFKSVQGPINIPTFIYGWGFMGDNSLSSLYIAKPVNPPIYQQIFLQNSFEIKSKQGTWEGELPKISSDEVQEFNSDEYEIYQLKDWNEINRFRVIILVLSSNNLSPMSRITPNPLALFDNFVDWVKTYGDLYMAQFLRYKPTREFVGCCICLPNPLRKKAYDGRDKFDSMVTYAIVINKEHRGKGLGMHLLKRIYDLARENGITYMSAPIEVNQVESRSIVQDKFHYSQGRVHLILERTL